MKIIRFLLFFGLSLLLVLFQNCSQNHKFESNNSAPITRGNGEGHEGKPSIPIDFVQVLDENEHYQQTVDISSDTVNGNGIDLDGIFKYCRSQHGNGRTGVDIALIQPPEKLNFFTERYSFSNTSGAGVRVERSSEATGWSSSGVLQTFSPNQPRMGVVSETGESGLFIEAGSTNLILNSEDISKASWTTTNATVGLSPSAAPTQSGVVHKISENQANGQWRYIQQLVPMMPHTEYSFSTYVKEIDAGRSIGVRLYDLGGGSYRCTFDFSTRSFTRNARSSPFDCYMEERPNGWFRIGVIGNSLSGSNPGRVKIELFKPSEGGIYDSTGHTGVSVWGVQLEAKERPTSYIPSDTSYGERTPEVAYFRENSPPVNGTMSLRWKLSQQSKIHLDFLTGTNKQVNVENGVVETKVGSEVVQRDTLNLQISEDLVIKLSPDSLMTYSKGIYISESPVYGDSFQDIQVSASEGGVLLEHILLDTKLLAGEVLSAKSRVDPDVGLSQAVLVLGRDVDNRERVQSESVSINIDPYSNLIFGEKNNLLLEPIFGDSYSLKAVLSDGTELDQKLSCIEVK